MPRKIITALSTLVLGAGAGAALGGCGASQTKTETVAETPTVSHAATTSSTQTHASTPAKAPAETGSATTATPNSAAGGAEAPASTRTATEPAFTHEESQSEAVKEAVSVLESRGYTPTETTLYHPSQTLRVLIGRHAGSGDGYGQQAFFFIDDRYIGTDTKEPSATVKVLSQGDTEVTLGYPLYRPGDSLADPTGGQASVHFQLNDGKLTPSAPIPPAKSATGLSRN
ncbi:MAG: LppP/LprE family lipoprotein [Solirubrobacteraceae bacterium]